MCGIAAIYRPRGPAVDRRDLARMASVLVHRGPDEAGIAVAHNDRLGLGHVRLSIVDLEHGQQPMWSADGRCVITYNGEIYDGAEHRRRLQRAGVALRTYCDTELILGLYAEHGLAMFEHLEGEFAFVLWDTQEQRLVAARDRSGVKPLYAYRDENEWVFASELKALATLRRIPRAISPQYVAGPAFGAFGETACILAGVDALKPGHVMVIEGGEATTRPYWSPQVTIAPIDFEEAKRAVIDTLERAVQRRMVADVPIGAYLSGGLDSTIICRLMAEKRAGFDVFTIGFSGTPLDETHQAHATANALGLRFHTLDCTLDRVAGTLESALFQVEHVCSNPHVVGKFLLSKLVHDAGVKVCLTGEGADEMFAGYPYFKLEQLWRMQRDETPQAAPLMARFEQMEARSKGLMWLPSEPWAAAQHPLGAPSFQHLRALSLTDVFQRVIDTEALGVSSTPADVFSTTYNLEAIRDLPAVHVTRMVARRTLTNYIIPNLGDRCEMAHSVECRLPFLDREVMAVADRMPPEHLLDIHTLREKKVLHAAFVDRLPAAIAHVHKHPFAAPSWTELRDHPQGAQLFGDYLSDAAIKRVGVLKPDAVTPLRAAWRAVPRSSVTHDKLDLLLGTLLSLQILAHRLILEPPVGNPDFVMPMRSSRPNA